MKKLLFLHGFYASGQCVPAMALKAAFEGKADVLTPDLPMHPKEAINFIRDIIDREESDILVGNSCGSFYAQMIAPIVGLPALLGNPHFKMTEFLKPRIGAHQYKSPRMDGKQDFIIDEQLIAVLQPLISFPWRPYAHSRGSTRVLCAADRKANKVVTGLLLFPESSYIPRMQYVCHPSI